MLLCGFCASCRSLVLHDCKNGASILGMGPHLQSFFKIMLDFFSGVC